MAFLSTRLGAQSLRCRISATSISSRSFTSSTILAKDGIGKDKVHTVNKQDEPNVQTDASKQGMNNRKDNTGGAATEQKDSTNSTAKAKQQHPEAPTTIGFQDERGGKGV